MTVRDSSSRRWQAAGWTLLVAVVLLLPGDRVPDPEGWEWIDKPVHAVLFAVHCGLMIPALRGPRLRTRDLVAGALVSGLLAVLLEVAQLWVPGRSWEWWDLGAASAGIALAARFAARRRARLPATT